MKFETEGTVEVRDHVLWISHVAGDPLLREWLEAVPAGAVLDLNVDGVAGVWRRIADGTDGRSSPGFKPVSEPIRSHWHKLQTSRGTHVSFRVDGHL